MLDLMEKEKLARIEARKLGLTFDRYIKTCRDQWLEDVSNSKNSLHIKNKFMYYSK
jgi:hypothetical protein